MQYLYFTWSLRKQSCTVTQFLPSVFLSFWILSIVWYSKKKTRRFEDWVRLRLQVNEVSFL